MRESRRQTREKTKRILIRITSLSLQLNPLTQRMEPAQEQERQILQLEQAVKRAALHRCNQRVNS